MKKILLLILCLAMFSGCSKPVSTNQNVVPNQNAATGPNSQRGNMANTPDGQLRMTISSITRIQRGKEPLTDDQKKKILPILKEIAKKQDGTKEYFDQKKTEIEGIFTATQKANTPQAGFGGNRLGQGQGQDQRQGQWQGQKQGQGQTPGNRPQRDPNAPKRDPNAPPRNSSGFGTIASICERVISTLENKEQQTKNAN